MTIDRDVLTWVVLLAAALFLLAFFWLDKESEKR